MIPDAFNGILYEADLEANFKEDDICWGCKNVVIVRYDKKYHGYRGYCPDCDVDYPLS